MDRFGKVEVKFSTSWTDKNGTHTSPVDKNEVDIYCVYCREVDECYYLRPEKFGSTVLLRVEAPKNGQLRNINFAADYRRVP